MSRISLAAYGSEDRLVAEVLDGDMVRAWLSGVGELSLYLDGLDEARGRIPHIASILADFIRRWPTDRLRLRIACRTADWPLSLETALDDAFGASGVFELLPLRRLDAKRLSALGVESDAFIEAVEERNVVPLASRPLTLRMLARLFARDHGLPNRAVDLYEQGLIALSDESDQRRRDNTHRTTSPVKIVGIASWIAALTTLGAKSSIWRGPLVNAEDSDLTEADWSVSFRGDQASSTTFDAVFRTGLFNGRGPQRLGWSHATFAEYLSARWIGASSMSTTQVQSLICADDGSVFPQVQQVAAWLVAIDTSRFGWLVRKDPSAFLRNIDIPDNLLKSEAVSTLIEKAAVGELFHDWSRNYRSLAHPQIASQLAPHLSSGAEESRQIAINIARDTRTTALLSNLASIALDADAPYRLRVSAAMAVESMADLERTNSLIPILSTELPEDSPTDGELYGAALLASWPHSLSTAEALDAVQIRHPRLLSGLYGMFLDRLTDSLAYPDLVAGMAWVTRMGNDADDERLRGLVGAVLAIAFEHLDEDSVLEWTRAFVAPRLTNGSEVFRQREGPIDLNIDSRRALSLALMRTCEPDQVIWIANNFAGSRLPLIGGSDLEWLIEQYEAAGDALRVNLGRAIQFTYIPDQLEHVEIALGLPVDHPVIRELLAGWFRTVELDSDEAFEGRERMRHYREMGEERTADAVDDSWINPRIDELLALSHGGNIGSYWQACRLVTVRPGTNQYWEDHGSELTQHARWSTLPATTQDAFVAGADRFLREARCEASDWLGLNRVSFIAIAAYQALVLLLESDQETLRSLPAQMWREWAPILIDWKGYGTNEGRAHKKELIGIAIPHAQNELIESLLTVIRAAGERYSGCHDELRELWSPALSSALVNIVDELPVGTQGEVLDAFGDCEPGAVRETLLSRLSATHVAVDMPKAVDAASRLLRWDARATWPNLCQLLEDQPDLMKEACLSRCGAIDQGTPDLDETALADLYLWLEEHFPRSEDPSFDEFHSIGPRETLGEWRDSILNALASFGTTAAVREVQRIVDQLNSNGWLRRMLFHARRAEATTAWQPLTASDIAELVASSAARLVRTIRDLVDISIDALEDIQRRLQSDTPEAPLLWDTISNRPKSEDEASDYLRARMNDYFSRRGIFVNREVQARRLRPSGIGERTDLRIDATSDANSPSNGETLSLVGEVKGAWNADLLTSLQSQLLNRYMADLGSTDGLYIIFWFDVEGWDASDTRRARALRRTKPEVDAAFVSIIEEAQRSEHRLHVFHLNASRARPNTAEAAGNDLT